MSSLNYTDAMPAAERINSSSLATAAGFMFAFRVCVTFLWFQRDPKTATVLTVAASLTLLGIVAGIQVISETPEGLKMGDHPVLRWIGIYLGLSAASLAWTTTPSTAAAAGYWSATAADVLTVLLLVRRDGTDNGAIGIMRGFVFGSMIVAVIAWASPVTADLRLGNEDFLHPNALGFEFAIATLFAVHLSRRRALPTWTIVALAVTLLRTLSKASIAAFLCAVIVYLLRASSIRRRTKLWIGVGGIAVVLSFWSLLDAYVDIYAQSDHVETLTGRTFIWAESLDIALERPWLGHGFYSFRWIVPPFGPFEAWHAHNEFLQQFFAYGTVGLLVTIALYYFLVRLIRRAAPSLEKELALAVLIFALVRGVVDTERFDLSFPLWLMAAFSVVLTRVNHPQPSATPDASCPNH
jgi:exopolysaccharide production protein ExoQ